MNLFNGKMPEFKNSLFFLKGSQKYPFIHYIQSFEGFVFKMVATDNYLGGLEYNLNF